MKNFLDIISNGILNKSGDELSARVTSTERKVLKVHTDGDKQKYSRTEYKNGTVVETETTKKWKKIHIGDGTKPSSIFMPFFTCSKYRNFNLHFMHNVQ